MKTLIILARVVSAVILACLAAPFAWEFATGDYFMTVTGQSMKPTYDIGDVLVVQEPRGGELEVPGTIVVVSFTPGDKEQQYVHRVVEVTEDGSILKGDNNETPDPNPVTDEQLMGTPRFAFTGTLGDIYRATQQPLVRIPLAALALLGLLTGLPGRPRRRRFTHVDESPVAPVSTREA